jgi:hypothetical protein
MNGELHRKLQASIAARTSEKRYTPLREVELRDEAVQALRELVAYLDGHHYRQMAAHVDVVGRGIVAEIDELHGLAILDAAGRVA